MLAHPSCAFAHLNALRALLSGIQVSMSKSYLPLAPNTTSVMNIEILQCGRVSRNPREDQSFTITLDLIPLLHLTIMPHMYFRSFKANGASHR